MALPTASNWGSRVAPTPQEEPRNLKKSPDGSDSPSDYQTALTLKEFMHANNMPFISRDQIDAAAESGFVKLDDNRTIALSDQEKAAFSQLKTAGSGLALRLDAGTTNTQDGWIGIQDIDDAIKQSWKLHGSDKSKDGHWADPFSDSTMTKDEVKQEVLNYMNSGGRTSVDPFNINLALDIQSLEPRVLEALTVLKRHQDEFNTDDNPFNYSIDEIKNWNTGI